jgi:2-polyprenyl-6-methoxyphenol hydroxylase-like FAD-dependent oxidoreductase
LCRRGGQRIDVCRDLAVATPYGWGIRFPSDLAAVGASRPLIEAVIRDRVIGLPRVRLLQEYAADELSGTSRHVTAVSVRDRKTGQTRSLSAALVVDASGRTSRLPAWLARLGCPPVAETVINANLRYASRLYRCPPPSEHSWDWKACYFLPFGPAATRGGVLAPIESGQWIATLSGAGDDRPSSRADEFLPFARSLTTPLIADILADAEPLTPVTCSNGTSNRRRHLAAAVGLPDNLLVIGDAACALNPLYAQGMTMAGLSARLLGQWLNGHYSAHRFHRRLEALHEAPWLLATTADRRFPTTAGPPAPIRCRLISRYLDRVLLAGTRNQSAQRAFLDVLTLVRGPSTFLSPPVILRATTARKSLAPVPLAPPRPKGPPIQPKSGLPSPAP